MLRFQQVFSPIVNLDPAYRHLMRCGVVIETASSIAEGYLDVVARFAGRSTLVVRIPHGLHDLSEHPSRGIDVDWKRVARDLRLATLERSPACTVPPHLRPTEWPVDA